MCTEAGAGARLQEIYNRMDPRAPGPGSPARAPLAEAWAAQAHPRWLPALEDGDWASKVSGQLADQARVHGPEGEASKPIGPLF